MKRILGMWGRGKVTVLAVVVALVLVMAPAALAANGKPLILGKASNVATKVTGLIGKVASGPALLVKNPNGGPALGLQVKTGKPPMKVNSDALVANLNADKLDGKDSSSFVQGNTNAFLRNSIYQSESALSTGALLGDGTRKISVSCAPGDVLLSGGPANIAAGTILLESFPKDNTWSARIQNDSTLDSFSVVALCANQ